MRRGMSDELTNLEAWRKQRAQRRAKERRQEQRGPRAVYPCRPGGNAPTVTATYSARRHPDVLERDPVARPMPPKYVPQNTHVAGSVAYALLYAYWRPK